MTVVVDTSVLVDHLRGHAGARDLLAHAEKSGERMVASVLTKVEILAGVRSGEQQATERLLSQLEWAEVNDRLAAAAGNLAAQWIRSHPGVEVVDYVIAATAQQLGAGLWTRNVKHFPMSPELAEPYG